MIQRCAAMNTISTGMIAIVTAAITTGRIARAHITSEQRDALRQRHLMPGIEEDQRQKISIPGGVESDDAQRRHRRTGERQGDLQEGPDMPGSIDPRRVKELLRHLFEKLAASKRRRTR